MCVSDQHENLRYFGHWVHFILAIYCNISFLFLTNVISVNTAQVRIFENCVKQEKWSLV